MKDGQNTPPDLAEAVLRRVAVLALLMGIYVLWMGMHCEGYVGTYWFYYSPWWLKTGIKFALGSLILSAAFYKWSDRVQRWVPWAFGLLLILAQVVLATAAWKTMDGGVPWGFDHPSFMYRLHEFGSQFPGALGGYHPAWNGGTEHFVGVTSGSHAFGMLIWPMLQMRAPHEFYGAALIFWFIVAFPWIGVWSVRSAGVSWIGSFCAGLLLSGVSRDMFMWLWHFGTVGAMTSAMMALPVTALGYRLAVLRKGGWGTALALGLSAWLMCLWTPGVFVGAGLMLGWLWNAREWTWKSNLRVLAAGVLALVLLVPWLWTTLFPCRSVVDYVGMNVARSGGGEMLIGGAVRLVRALESWHPVLLFMGLIGVFWAAPPRVRRWGLPALLLLGGIAGWSREWKPLSQMERMVIPMASVAVFPAAVLCGKLFGGRERREFVRGRAILWALGQGVVLTALLFGIREARTHYTNASPAPMRMLSPEMESFSEWIRTEVPKDARVGFAGKSLHFYGGGNLAYFPILAGREMMADDYYGFPCGTVEYNYPPAAYRESMEDWLFFSRAYGVSHWVGTVEYVRQTMEAYPSLFEKVRSMEELGQTIEVFRVKEPGPLGRFWEGSGTVTAQINKLLIEPADPSVERVVIRYNWREGLICKTAGASIEPVAIDENLTFIGVHPGGNQKVQIRYRVHASQIKPNFDGHFHH